MKLVTKYIMTHSNGKQAPICGSAIAQAFNIPDTEVRKLINEARCDGDPICSGRNGYHIASDKEEIQKTIASIQGRIMGMNKAINGLEHCLSCM